jgi:hypothetical protein
MFLWARCPVGLYTGISVRANVPRRARPYVSTVVQGFLEIKDTHRPQSGPVLLLPVPL